MHRLFYLTAATALAAGIAVSSPVVTNIVPATLVSGDRAQVVRVQGKEFLPDLTLYVTSPDGGTMNVSGSAIQARTDTAFQVSLVLATAGRYQFVVTNTDGGTSEPFPVDVGKPEPAPDAPVITTVTPAEPVKHPEPQVLRVDGQRFESGLRPILTDPVGTEVTEVEVAKVTATSFELRARLSQAGTYELVVSNPSGAVSNVFQILVR